MSKLRNDVMVVEAVRVKGGVWTNAPAERMVHLCLFTQTIASFRSGSNAKDVSSLEGYKGTLIAVEALGNYVTRLCKTWFTL